jgi:uncharacterized protein YjbI with pentapeptide repeats
MKQSENKSPKDATEVNACIVAGNRDFRRAQLSEESFVSFNLVDADFTEADLTKATFHCATLDGAIFAHSKLSGARLGKPPFNPHVTINGQPYYPPAVSAKKVNFRRADLSNADLSYADLSDADLRGANLRQADLTGANLTGVKFNRFGKYLGIKGLDTISGNPLFYRFAKDQEYIESFIQKYPLRYTLWLLMSDCGRSFMVWLLWTVLIVAGFGCLFSQKPGWFEVRRGVTVFTHYYFSVVTFTTLGFGDIVPKTIGAEIAVVAEVLLGYIMLGVLVSIAVNRWVRRA